uniref:Tumor protein p63-regulated gene 1-like protein n=1 Tax=Lygus hesperus TaxID=30085 RepID=A0A0A9YIB9_LYGHE
MKHEESLDDGPPTKGFESATLQLDNDGFRARQELENLADLDSDGLMNGNPPAEKQAKLMSSADRPKSLALIPWSGNCPTDFFSYRDGLVSSAVEECRAEVMNEEDGALVGAWLLTEISFWDNEKERLILLTTKSLITVKYDFITLRPLDNKKVPLELIDTVIIGELSYPPISIIPSRNMSGVRVMWNQGKPMAFVKKWNPFEKEIPFCTFTSHPLLWHAGAEEADEKKVYNVDDFTTSLKDALERKIKTFQCSVQHKSILLENYVGLGSLIHNKNSLGFFKVRGKFSF